MAGLMPGSGGMFGGLIGGAGGGGAIASDTGPLGMGTELMTGVTGIQPSRLPFVGGLFPNPDEKAMRQAMADAAASYQAARPQSAAAWNAALGNMMGAYSPAQSALAQMYGGTQAPPPAGPPPGQPMAQAQSMLPSQPPKPQGASAIGGLFGGGPVASMGGMLRGATGGLFGGAPGAGAGAALGGFVPGGGPLGGMPGAGGLAGLLGGGGLF